MRIDLIKYLLCGAKRHGMEVPMNNSKGKLRNSNIEILRIISIVLIMAHHYVIHGFNGASSPNLINQSLLGFLSIGGKLGVTCFILISGYYMLYSTFTLKKFIKILAEVWFYSVAIGLLCFLIFNISDFKVFIKIFIPIGSSEYWFVTNYLILMIFSPILNLIIKNIERIFLKKIILIAVIFWSILPTFFGITYAFDELLWFVILYLIAGYIRRYSNINKNNANKHFIVSFISYSIIIIFNIIFILLGNFLESNTILNYSTHLSILNSPFVLLTAVELFSGFIRLKVINIKLINIISSTTLGIYLIHDNYLLRTFIWENIFKCNEIYNSNYLIVHFLISILLLFFVCFFIDLIRQITVEKLFFNFIETKGIKIKQWTNKLNIINIERINKFIKNYNE